MKKALILTGCVIVLIAFYFVISKHKTDLSPTIQASPGISSHDQVSPVASVVDGDLESYRSLLVDSRYEKLSPDTKLMIDSTVTNPSETKKYLFVTAPELAGSKSYSGIILEVVVSTKVGRVVGEFAGLSSPVTDVTFSPDERYFFYAIRGNESVDCSREYTSIVDTTGDNAVSYLMPPIKIGTNDEENMFVWSHDVKWIDNATLDLEASIADCNSNWEGDSTLASTHWQYDMVSRKFSN